MRHDDDAMWEDFDRYAYEAQFEDDGQPDEHTEWQDVYGGDDYVEQWECDY